MAGNAGAKAALDRLEQALARITAASACLKSGDKHIELEARHRHLQDEVQAALSGLDRLLSTAEAR